MNRYSRRGETDKDDIIAQAARSFHRHYATSVGRDLSYDAALRLAAYEALYDHLKRDPAMLAKVPKRRQGVPWEPEDGPMEPGDRLIYELKVDPVWLHRAASKIAKGLGGVL